MAFYVKARIDTICEVLARAGHDERRALKAIHHETSRGVVRAPLS